jgi:hypothetical protein
MRASLLLANLTAGLALLCGTALATGCATARPQLEPARVHASSAEEIALTKVPNGTVIRRVLQIDRGKLVWAIDVAPPADAADARRVTVVQVDAVTGAIDTIDKETMIRRPQLPATPQASEKVATDD